MGFKNPYPDGIWLLTKKVEGSWVTVGAFSDPLVAKRYVSSHPELFVPTRNWRHIAEGIQEANGVMLPLLRLTHWMIVSDFNEGIIELDVE